MFDWGGLVLTPDLHLSRLPFWSAISLLPVVVSDWYNDCLALLGRLPLLL